MLLIFMGTPDFAVPALNALAGSKHNVISVFTQRDKPKGRGYVLEQPPVKKAAEQMQLPVFQPDTLKSDETHALIKKMNPEIIVVAAYGKILPKSVLDIPKFGCINIHGSLLPLYRGAAPIQRAVIDGQTETGITIMQMAEGLDTGDILLREKTCIGENETSKELFDRMALLGAEALIKALDLLETGGLIPVPQDESKATYAAKVDKTMSEILWDFDAAKVHNLIRGLNPWPSAQTSVSGKRVKIHKSRIAEGSGPSGTVISVSPLIAACGSGAVELLELQPEGKKRMRAKDFISGYRIKTGDILGEA